MTDIYVPAPPKRPSALLKFTKTRIVILLIACTWCLITLLAKQWGLAAGIGLLLFGLTFPNGGKDGFVYDSIMRRAHTFAVFLKGGTRYREPLQPGDNPINRQRREEQQIIPGPYGQKLVLLNINGPTSSWGINQLPYVVSDDGKHVTIYVTYKPDIDVKASDQDRVQLADGLRMAISALAGYNLAQGEGAITNFWVQHFQALSTAERQLSFIGENGNPDPAKLPAVDSQVEASIEMASSARSTRQALAIQFTGKAFFESHWSKGSPPVALAYEEFEALSVTTLLDKVVGVFRTRNMRPAHPTPDELVMSIRQTLEPDFTQQIDLAHIEDVRHQRSAPNSSVWNHGPWPGGVHKESGESVVFNDTAIRVLSIKSFTSAPSVSIGHYDRLLYQWSRFGLVSHVTAARFNGIQAAKAKEQGADLKRQFLFSSKKMDRQLSDARHMKEFDDSQSEYERIALAGEPLVDFERFVVLSAPEEHLEMLKREVISSFYEVGVTLEEVNNGDIAKIIYYLLGTVR